MYLYDNKFQSMILIIKAAVLPWGSKSPKVGIICILGAFGVLVFRSFLGPQDILRCGAEKFLAFRAHGFWFESGGSLGATIGA